MLGSSCIRPTCKRNLSWNFSAEKVRYRKSALYFSSEPFRLNQRPMAISIPIDPSYNPMSDRFCYKRWYSFQPVEPLGCGEVIALPPPSSPKGQGGSGAREAPRAIPSELQAKLHACVGTKHPWWVFLSTMCTFDCVNAGVCSLLWFCLSSVGCIETSSPLRVPFRHIL